MSLTGNATGVLLAWKRLDNLYPIIRRMLEEPWIKEILVWSNRSVVSTYRISMRLLEAFPRRVQVIGNGHNIYTLGRYIAAQQAPRPLIVTCDDDCIVDNWLELRDKCMETKRLVCNIAEGHYDYAKKTGWWNHKYSGGTVFETLVGWGACFHRDMVKVLDLYMSKYGQDELLQRKADRFFTILQDRGHLMLKKQVNHLPGATDSTALYRMRDHRRLTTEAQRVAIELLEGAKCTES